MDQEEMRPLFESAFSRFGYSMERTEAGFYLDDEVNHLFSGWCAGGNLYYSRMYKKYRELELRFDRLAAKTRVEVDRPNYLQKLKVMIKASQP